MKKWVFISLSLATASVVGCSIEVNEGHSDWDDEWYDDTIEERAADACQPYCLRLIGCEVLSDSSFSACVELCEERYIEDEDTVEAGCACVSNAACDEQEALDCEGDPIPDVWSDGDDAVGDGDGDGDAVGGGGSSSGDGGPDGTSCVVNHDCTVGEDCIEGQCLSRCAASCQCGDGMACEDGYCRTPEEPAAECEDTCDCTAGDVCVDGYCE